MKKYKIVKSFDVQVTYELEARNAEEAEKYTDPKNAVNEDWEHKSLIESKKL